MVAIVGWTVGRWQVAGAVAARNPGSGIAVMLAFLGRWQMSDFLAS